MDKPNSPAPIRLRPFIPYLVRLAALTSCALLTACVSSRVQVSKESKMRQRQWAMLCKDSAMLSAIAYRNNPKDPHGPKEAGQPLDKYLRMLAADGWVHRGTCLRGKGIGENLCFEVWENRSRKPRRVIIAFRGTKGTVDWLTNLRWFFRSRRAYDHYGIAPEECLPIIASLRKESPAEPPLISTTGHSLGGGLAQQLLYVASNEVDHCVAFDPSPVTAFHDLDKSFRDQYRSLGNREQFTQYRIIRAYEKGEVLSGIRNFLQIFYKPGSLTRAVEFQSANTRGGPIGKHSMNMLAETIIIHAEQEVTPPPKAEYKVKRLDRSRYLPVEPAFRPVHGGTRATSAGKPVPKVAKRIGNAG